MTPAAFADLLRARPAGRDRWQARCPAHGDRAPFLSIREGRDGRILLTCFAGCDKAAVLRALGLTWRDLFSDAPVDPRAREKARREECERDAAQRERAKAERRPVTSTGGSPAWWTRSHRGAPASLRRRKAMRSRPPSTAPLGYSAKRTPASAAIGRRGRRPPRPASLARFSQEEWKKGLRRNG